MYSQCWKFYNVVTHYRRIGLLFLRLFIPMYVLEEHDSLGLHVISIMAANYHH
jgi:hypothetical protein